MQVASGVNVVFQLQFVASCPLSVAAVVVANQVAYWVRVTSVLSMQYPSGSFTIVGPLLPGQLAAAPPVAAPPIDVVPPVAVAPPVATVPPVAVPPAAAPAPTRVPPVLAL